MSLFQIVSILGIGGALAAIPVHYLLVARKAPPPGLGMRTVRRYGLWERLIHLVLLLCFLVLAVTGFWASIGWDGPMSGYVLMLHTTSGAVFAVAAGCMLVTWAADHAFAKPDARWFCGGGCCTPVKELPAGRFTAGEKVYFWLAGLLTLTALLTMLLSMIPLLGTYGQHLMYHVHRWSTLVLVVATIWHAYATTLAKPGALGALVSGYVTEGWVKRFHPLWGAGAGPAQPHAD